MLANRAVHHVVQQERPHAATIYVLMLDLDNVQRTPPAKRTLDTAKSTGRLSPAVQAAQVKKNVTARGTIPPLTLGLATAGRMQKIKKMKDIAWRMMLLDRAVKPATRTTN